MNDATVAVAVARAMCATLLDHIIEPMRRVARDAGYAITVHGSLARDIDLVAIPWVDREVEEPDHLVEHLCGAVAGVIGRCNPMKDWDDKPHGRKAKTLLVWSERFGCIHLDLSVMPTIQKPEDGA